MTAKRTSCGAVTPATVLALDFNDRGGAGAANTMSGFTEFLLAGLEGATQTTTTRAFGAFSVTLNAIGTTMDDRLRTTPANSGAYTESLLGKDFVFASSTAAGLDVRIQGLTAGVTYLVLAYVFAALMLGAAFVFTGAENVAP